MNSHSPPPWMPRPLNFSRFGTRPSDALDAMADARTVLVNTRVRFGSALWLAQQEGSRAVVAVLDGDVYLAGLHTEVAVRAARKALRALRG